MKQTNLERYGTEYPIQNKDVQDKRKQTNLERYGTEYPSQNKEIQEKIKQTNLERYGTEYPMQNEYFQEKQQQTFYQRYGVHHSFQLPQNRFRKADSQPNLDFVQLLEDNSISYEREFPLNSYTYDFKVGNILIEINPTETHNSHWHPNHPSYGLDKDYHYNKTKNALENGYVCLNVFDWDNVNNTINILKSNQPIKQIKDSIMKHWYNIKTEEHLLDNNLNDEEMIQKGFLPIYDSGYVII
jgi:hypothetical protein